ncbi:MAG: thiamine phosphate synthase [Gemmatimonadaceae bacterium]|nr:thiamine phosphate synthase [Gemmatimonadaceae bacterium]
MTPQAFPVVHAVTDSGAVLHGNFLERASGIMRALGPRGALHLRSSRASAKQLHELATLLSLVQKSTGCWLIVNDRVDIAAAVGARGAQLASHSLAIAEARIVAPDLPLGASIHSVAEALKAESEGASWCVAGTVFETPSHVGRAPARIEFIEQVAAAVKIPIIAIGGITPEDVAALRRAGAYGVATIRGADWDRGHGASADEDKLMRTRLPVTTDAGFAEPVTRYISAYDSESGSDRDDHPDGERVTPGAGAE